MLKFQELKSDASITLTLSTILRFIYSLAPIITSAVQYWRNIQRRLRWATKTQDHVGKIPSPFWLIDVAPQKLFGLLLGIIVLVSLGSLIEGSLLVSDSRDNEVLKWLSNNFQPGIFENSIWILVAWLIFAVIVGFNIVPRGLLLLTRLRSTTSYTPGWINAAWHIRLDDSADPVNIDPNGCESVANQLVKAMSSGNDYGGDRLSLEDIDDEELANLLLFGCVIEGKTNDLGIRIPDWKDFYDALGHAARHTEQPFLPNNIMSFNERDNSFYQFLSDLCRNNYQLPKGVAIEVQVTKVLRLLKRAFDGSARKIAFNFFHQDPSIDLAFKRAAKFHGLDGDQNESMRVQFLKVAIRHGIWPGIYTGPFLFPFSKNIAVLLFNDKCMVTRPNVKSIGITRDLAHLVAYTESVIVDKVKEFFADTRDAKIKAYSREKFGCEPTDLPEWKLFDEVDYLLWYLARHSDKEASQWRLEAESLVRD